MRVLDLFCGEGGASVGYHHAGFTVFGIDNSVARLKRYPFECDSADALAYATVYGHHYDLIHASPPCTGYTRGTVGVPDRLNKYDRLIAATRDLLVTIGKPYIIENVEDARTEMDNPVLLCARMFGIGTHDTDGTFVVMDRHRLFESNLPLHAPRHPDHHRGKLRVAGAYGGARTDAKEARWVRGGGYTPHARITKKAMGVEWMTTKGAQLCIPPAYTRYLGKQINWLPSREPPLGKPPLPTPHRRSQATCSPRPAAALSGEAPPLARLLPTRARSSRSGPDSSCHQYQPQSTRVNTAGW